MGTYGCWVQLSWVHHVSTVAQKGQTAVYPTNLDKILDIYSSFFMSFQYKNEINDPVI